MKCKYCGGNITLETAFCPYCGKPNEHAQKHVRDMEKYQGVYEETRSDLQEAANRYTGSTVRIIIIAVLIILIILLLLLAGNAYSIKRAWIQAQNNKNAETVMKQMDEYLENEDFIAFTHFCNENYIDTYETEFEVYMPVERASQSYSYVYNSIMEVACPPTYADANSRIEYLAENLDYFYNNVDMSQYEYFENIDIEKNEKALAAMEEKVELLLVTYCNFTEEEAKSMKSMSNAKRAVTIEEAILDEE